MRPRVTAIGELIESIADRFPDGLWEWSMQFSGTGRVALGRWERAKWYRDLWSLKRRMHPAQLRTAIAVLESAESGPQ